MLGKHDHHQDRPDSAEDALHQLRRPEPTPEFVRSLHDKMAAQHNGARPNRRYWPWAVVPLSAGGAIAAMLLIAFVLWPKPAAGFDRVQDRMRRVSTMSCVAHLVVNDPRVPADILTVTAWADEIKGAKTEARVLGIPVLSSLVHWNKEGWLTNHLRNKTMAVPAQQIALSKLRELDPTRLVLDLRRQEGIRATLLEDQMINGEKTLVYRLDGGFMAKRPGMQMTMWVSTRTQLPVRLECRLPAPEQGHVDFVVDQFKWDEPLPAALFDAPPDVNAKFIMDVEPRPNAAILLAGLRDFSLYTGGYYPGHPLADQALVLLVMKLRSASEQGGSWAEQNREEAALFEKMVNGGVFLLMQAGRGRLPEYNGLYVTASDADRELISWQNDRGARDRFAGNLILMPPVTSDSEIK